MGGGGGGGGGGGHKGKMGITKNLFSNVSIMALKSHLDGHLINMFPTGSQTESRLIYISTFDLGPLLLFYRDFTEIR